MAVTQKSTIAHLATDPLRGFKFLVDIRPPSGAAISIGFMSVSGLNITADVIAYREGGMNTTTQKMPGQSDFAPITLSRGVAVGHNESMDWLHELFTVLQGTGNGPAGHDFRRTVDVRVLDHPVTKGNVPVKGAFRVYNAWPTSVSFSDLDAGASQLLITQLTLAHEGWEFKLADKIGMDEVSF